MKKIFLALSAMAWISAQAQTADEVIQKYSAAMGGLEAFQKVKTAKITGTVNIQDNDFALTMQIINGKAMRNDVDVMGKSVINVYNDGKGWKINPFAGIETATDAEGAELNDLKYQSNLASILMDYKNQGHKVELMGEEIVDGVNTYKLKLTTKEDGRVTVFYINKADNLLVKSITARDIQGQMKDVITVYSDLKEFGGLKFYTVRTQSIEGLVFQIITFNNVELNVAVDEKIFDKQ